MNAAVSTQVDKFAAAIADAGPVAVEGRRTRWSTGGDLAVGTRLLSAPAGIVEHRPEEMTVRVLAGTTVAALETALSARGQRSALADRGGTVGGAIAVGENHLESIERGNVRASLLQVRYVAHDGRVVTGGAPTVKNVAGFDLPRLMVGSLGTLGLFAEVTLRTNPIPQASLWIHSNVADAFAVRETLLAPATVLWDGHQTWVHLEGHLADVHAQRDHLDGRWDDADGPPPLPPHRWSLPPSTLRTRMNLAPPPYVASIGVGIVFASAAMTRTIEPEVRRLCQRAKCLFDPTGRLNPGRDPARCLQ